MEIYKILLIAAGIMWPVTIILFSRVMRQNDKRIENIERKLEKNEETCKEFAVIKDRCDHQHCIKKEGE